MFFDGLFRLFLFVFVTRFWKLSRTRIKSETLFFYCFFE
ncbi:hypothetical protein CKA32_000382 [Geitlerinema sp. FC II]|nr:hypothetical protein CKA32_000382 [Geitlerinema sp. FC II]